MHVFDVHLQILRTIEHSRLLRLFMYRLKFLSYYLMHVIFIYVFKNNVNVYSPVMMVLKSINVFMWERKMNWQKC